ncbi:MAG: DUF2231 domain-containing protein [Nocardioidaceae bacterium]|nr:DUF2231 domain-containing protein [Nocardioidaceae bacterium]
MEQINEQDGRPDNASTLVNWTRRVEESSSLDWFARALRPAADALIASPGRRYVLHGTWLGHAVHPVLTDLPIGFWTSTNVLDLVGGRQSRPAARRLLALGVLSAVPTVATGVAEWATTGQREKRVGVVHAAANAVALGLYAASYSARSRDRHAQGVALALAGSATATVGGYLGGHLTAVRKVSSRHPGFEPRPA